MIIYYAEALLKRIYIYIYSFIYLAKEIAGYAALIILRSVALLCCFAFLAPEQTFAQTFRFLVVLFFHPYLPDDNKGSLALVTLKTLTAAHLTLAVSACLLLSLRNNAYRLRRHTSTFYPGTIRT